MTVPVFEEQIPPSTEPYGVLADAEAEAQEAVEESTIAQILFAWYVFSGEDDGSHSVFYDGGRVVSFADEVAQLIRSAQREASAVTESYIRSAVEQMHEDFDLPDRILLPNEPIVDLPADLRLGANTEDVYQRPIRKLRYLVSEDQPLESVLQTVEQRIESQARTDLQLARTYSAQQVMYRFPRATGWRRIIHPELGNVCGLCIAASDRVYTRIEKMDIHPGCVTGDMPISASGVAAATRRRYAGPLVVLRTASGQDLRLTPNHPVLTEQGWVSAGRLQKGDRVVRHGGSQRDGRGVPGEQQQPVRAQDVWRALTVASSLLPRTVPLASEDLHGDARFGENEVDVVLVDGHLAPVGSVSFVEPCSELGLRTGHGGRVGLTGQGVLAPVLNRLWTPTISGVGRSRDSLSFGRIPLIAKQASFSSSANRDTGAHEPSSHQRTREAERVRDGQFRFARQVAADDFIVRGVATAGTTRFDPSGDESTVEGRRSYVELGRQLQERLAGSVQFDEVVEVDVVAFTGHVYNFQTREGWYDAHSIVVSNCKCTLLPIVLGVDPGKAVNADDLSRLYEAAGDTTDSRALSKLRVQVRQNGELGPILTADGTHFTSRAERARQLSPAAAEQRRLSIESQLAALRARVTQSPNQWYSDRIEQLEELAAA